MPYTIRSSVSLKELGDLSLVLKAQILYGVACEVFGLPIT